MNKVELLPYQVPPKGAWDVWILAGPRGAGKTVALADALLSGEADVAFDNVVYLDWSMIFSARLAKRKVVASTANERVAKRIAAALGKTSEVVVTVIPDICNSFVAS